TGGQEAARHSRLKLLLNWLEFGFERFAHCESTYLKNGKAYHFSALIHAFHHRVMRGLPHVTSAIRKDDFQKIPFLIEPNFYFIGHTCSPLLGLSVRYAVNTNASSGAYFTTTQSHLSPICVP